MTPFIFQVTDELWRTCHKFAVDMDEVSGPLYAERNNQKDPATRIRQGRESKIGEQAAAEYLRSHYTDPLRVKGPDYTVLPPEKKSWAHDLSVDNYGVACKCCTTHSAETYGLGWIFENSDRVHRKHQNVVFIGCWYDPQSNQVMVLPVIPVIEVLTRLTLPDEPHLKTTKQAARYRKLQAEVKQWQRLPKNWWELKPLKVVAPPLATW